MRTIVLSVHPGLAQSSRLPVLVGQERGLQVAEMLLLLAAGVGAALATALLDFGLRIPGHAIIRAVFPMSLGLALAPRRLGGMVMGVSALGSAVALGAGGLAGLGAGAMTSLALTGPFLDLALWRAGRGWRLYLGFALAGLGSNLAALGVRAGTKLVGLGHPAARPLAEWWPQAIGSYALCGLLAGLISAAVWFRFVASTRRGADSEAMR
jgi:hypothetical protein